MLKKRKELKNLLEEEIIKLSKKKAEMDPMDNGYDEVDKKLGHVIDEYKKLYPSIDPNNLIPLVASIALCGISWYAEGHELIGRSKLFGFIPRPNFNWKNR